MFVQWRDAAGNWSTPISDTIELDNTGPTGTVEINDGDAETDSILVNLGLSATDASGVASVLIANDADRLHRRHAGPVRADRAASARRAASG